MEPTVMVLIAVAVLALGALIKAVHIVPQARAYMVERLGRYTRTLDGGLNFLIPFVDSISYRIDLREQVVTFPPQPMITQDNMVVSIDTVVYFQVRDPRKATYEIANHIVAIEQLTLNALRRAIGRMDLERTLAARQELNTELRGVLDEATGKWGIRVNLFELRSIEPPRSVVESMENRMRAKLEKDAAIITAEGIRRRQLTEAETKRDVAAILGDENGATRVAPRPRSPEPDGRPAPRPAHEPLRPDDPRTVGRYRLTARLGQGGMGTVYLGRSPGERLVAVKVIQTEFADDATFRRRFHREIEAARRVGGFHTAAVIDADADSEPPWLVTEYIPGPSLGDVLKGYGAMPTRTLHTLALGIAEALEGIHACGIIHRDLKPSNVIVSTAGPRVIDFGIARSVDSTALTRTNMVIGTQGFLAPEQLVGAASTPAVDIYAFGMVLCHAAGAVPFEADETLGTALALLPSTLADVITRCVDHDPARRPTSTEVLEQLTRNHSPSEDWLPPPVRTLVQLHNTPTALAP